MRENTQLQLSDTVKPWRLWLTRGLTVVLCVMSFVVIVQWAITQLNQPIATVKIEGQFQRLTESEVTQVLEPYVNERFMQVDLAQIQEVVHALPWVSNVTVRRIWPNGIAIKIKEEKAIARWGQNQLLDEEGRAFSPTQLQEDVAALPALSGPPGYEQAVMQQYKHINQLLRPLNRRITSLTLAARGAWDLELDGGMKVMLGKDHLLEKIQRFIHLYETELVNSTEKILAVDVRYSNGVAVHFSLPPEESAEKVDDIEIKS